MTEVLIEDARDIAASAFIDGWVDDLGDELTPFVLEDEGFADPDSGATVDPPTEEWARFSVIHIGPRAGNRGPQVNIGGVGHRKFERGALAMIQVYTRISLNAKRGDVLAAKAVEIFEVQNHSGLKFEGGNFREAGKDGKMRMMVAEIPFFYQATK
jgi:hypothetical protein